MKKALLTIAGLAVAALVTTSAWAGSWTGWITDDHCGAGGAKAGHEKCAKDCVKGGGKYVFYNTADKKIYQIDNQQLAEQNLGYEVTVTGEAEGDAIKVASIAKK
ncbi:MAG TPA: hypothetical protein VF017_16710 [Thermoanaerobaculia bacterium]|nr:hypothetical protein [Thermoanaerobaculia bacterium]